MVYELRSNTGHEKGVDMHDRKSDRVSGDEGNTKSKHRARESETHRSNVANEDIARANLAQRAYEYADMAPYIKAEKAAKTAESAAKTAKTVKDTFNPLK